MYADENADCQLRGRSDTGEVLSFDLFMSPGPGTWNRDERKRGVPISLHLCVHTLSRCIRRVLRVDREFEISQGALHSNVRFIPLHDS